MSKSISIAELKQQRCWVNWHYFNRDGKMTKPPLNPHTGDNAKVNDPQTWGDYALALHNTKAEKCDGIGIMVIEGKEYSLCGIDIDGHKDGSNPLQAEIMELFKGTYMEVSPSGQGIHILLLLRKDYVFDKDKYYTKNAQNELECYVAGFTSRYLTFTASGADVPITEQTATFKQFIDKYMRKSDWQPNKPSNTSLQAPQCVVTPTSSNNIDVIDVARKARNGNKFTALYDSGDISAYNGDDSAADIALCSMLAFYLQGDYGNIDKAYRGSALMRPKWEREDYRAATISKAVASCNGKFYTPPKAAKNKHTGEGEKEEKLPDLDKELFEQYLLQNCYKLRNNEITHKFEYEGFKGENPENLGDLVSIRLYDELSKLYKKVSRPSVDDYIYWTAANNNYNPVLDLINAEIGAGETGERGSGWDGIDRIEQIYQTFGIADNDTLSRSLIKKWLMQAYCGLYNNSADPFSLDIILVFQGGQGIGKTRFFEKLALQSKYFGDGITLDPRDKDSIMYATANWIAELGELGSTMKKDIDSVKAFITRSTDTYRPPYGRQAVTYPRRTSFVGTVNDEQFLIDQTGNRRFATVPLRPTLSIDYDTQIEPFNALQLWVQVAEIVAAELAKGKTYANCFRLNRAELAQLAMRNSSFTKPLKGEIEIIDTLNWSAAEQQGYEVFEEWQSVTAFKTAHSDELRNVDTSIIGRVLGKLGYDKRVGNSRNKTTEYLLPVKRWVSQN